MKFPEIYRGKKPVFSLEIFPPKNSDGEKELFETLDILNSFCPAFISITYGAGGKTREKTLSLALKIMNRYEVDVVPHYTCVNSSRDEIAEYLQEIEDAGIENILALRGDPPIGEKEFKKPENGFQYANELVKFIKRRTSLSIGVAGYPEGHKESLSKEIDLKNLKKKIDAGADVVITQLFYNNSYFTDFINRARNIGIKIPIIPGILPITNLKLIDKITNMCGATIPKNLHDRLQAITDTEKRRDAGINFAITQCQMLLQEGVAGIHFYTLNKSYATAKILENLEI